MSSPTPPCTRCGAPMVPSQHAPELSLGAGHEEYTYSIRLAWWMCIPCKLSRSVEDAEVPRWDEARRRL